MTKRVGAGPALDRLVGERVMGCRLRRTQKGLYDLVIPGGVDQIDFVEPDAPWLAMPAYSSDIAAAWTVVEHFALHNDYWVTVTVGGMPGQGASCVIQQYERGDDHKHIGPEVVGIGWTVPEAISKAALAAMGVEVPA